MALASLPARKPSLPIDYLAKRDLEFRQETIYFIVVDRFFDGDPANSAGPNPALYDPERRDWNRYWGGDLQGIIDKLDYLQGLGVTALWLTPLFEQVEKLAYDKHAAIHGYWTQDFKRLNRRYIGVDEDPSLKNRAETTFDRLVAAMHARGMKLVLDIVCNHSSPTAEGTKGLLFDDGRLVADFNDDPEHWYHHYGELKDWRDEWQIKNCELAGLASFNENNVKYRNYIKSAIKLWLDRGVDALRIDTVKHMPAWFWQEFISDMLTHRPDVFIFGEWIYNHPTDGQSAAFANQAGMSLLDFGLCMALRQAIGKSDAAGFVLVNDVLSLDSHYDNASELVTFIENHDMHRFLSLNPDPKALGLALIVLLTTRGIPCLYYGSEQELNNSTHADDGLPWGNNDPYNRPMMESWDEQKPLYKLIAALTELRRLNPAVALGSQHCHHVAVDTYAYSRRYRDYRCFVAVNKAGAPVTLENIQTDLPGGVASCYISGQEITINDDGLATLVIEPQSAVVLSLHNAPPVAGRAVVRVQVNGIATQPGQVVVVTGDCPELGNWDVSRAFPLEYINSNCWFGEIAFNETAGGRVAYKYALREQMADGDLVPQRENVICRRRVLPASGLTKWRDHWGARS
ncbi:alpha-amylase family glycosyl hydrolase [Horticoccus sp. 23ND18S-11]|uniref:alpha-amylase family glycosyl hydrolase n=1 Tax=Horticoccus sp. 23ND18S-11 TaxID=3391832 RepID=UPI0039C97296